MNHFRNDVATGRKECAAAYHEMHEVHLFLSDDRDKGDHLMGLYLALTALNLTEASRPSDKCETLPANFLAHADEQAVISAAVAPPSSPRSLLASERCRSPRPPDVSARASAALPSAPIQLWSSVRRASGARSASASARAPVLAVRLYFHRNAT